MSASEANNKYIGEQGSEITIGSVGTEISSKVGETAAFETGNGEYFKCFIKDATTLSKVSRGYFFDNTGAPVDRANLSSTHLLTLMKLGWIFVENNGTTIDVTYVEPSMTFTAPSSPASGDYWLDLTNQIWKRYSGTSWEIINRTLIGEFICDATNCIGTRPTDYENGATDLNNIALEVSTTEIIKTKNPRIKIDVYGTQIDVIANGISWNITTDLDTGSEAADTLYYLYLSDQGETIVSLTAPYDRKDLQGWYHPHHSYRCVGAALNDTSSDFILAADYITTNFQKAGASGNFFAAGATYEDITNQIFHFIFLDKSKNLHFNGGAEVAGSGAYLSEFYSSGNAALYVNLDLDSNGINASIGQLTTAATGTRASMPASAVNWVLEKEYFSSAVSWYRIALQTKKNAGSSTNASKMACSIEVK